MYRRLLSLALAVMLAAALIPLSALAEDMPVGIVRPLEAFEEVTRDIPGISDDAQTPAEPEAEQAAADEDEIVPELEDVDVAFGETGAEITYEIEDAVVSAEASDAVIGDAAEAEAEAEPDPVIEETTIAEAAPAAQEAPQDSASNEAAAQADGNIPAEAATIGEAPTYGGVFVVYDTYFNFYPYDMAMSNQAYDLYMEYSSDGVNWSRTNYMRANWIKLFIQQGYEISGLAPNTTYLTRIMYGKYLSSGEFVTGPSLDTLTIKTGDSAAPAIKKVTLKAKKVKKHRVRHAGYYNYVGGMLFWHKAYTERYYTCKIKAVVKLKKKPGTNGMWISVGGQSKFVPGNKKKYSATFTPYPNYFAKRPKKGRYKYEVIVRSAQDGSWGGYSAPWTKVKKLK